MTRVTEHTRGATPAKCSVCGDAIKPGDRYRRMVAVQENWAAEPFFLVLICDLCVGVGGDYWRLTSDREREANARAESDARISAPEVSDA